MSHSARARSGMVLTPMPPSMRPVLTVMRRYLSVVSVGEIERGIVRQRHRDPAFVRVLGAWLDSVLALYGERILAADLSTARRWGRHSGALGHEGADLLIEATAVEHGLTVVTRNVRHFEPTGVPVLDPSVPRG